MIVLLTFWAFFTLLGISLRIVTCKCKTLFLSLLAHLNCVCFVIRYAFSMSSDSHLVMQSSCLPGQCMIEQRCSLPYVMLMTSDFRNKSRELYFGKIGLKNSKSHYTTVGTFEDAQKSFYISNLAMERQKKTFIAIGETFISSLLLVWIISSGKHHFVLTHEDSFETRHVPPNAYWTTMTAVSTPTCQQVYKKKCLILALHQLLTHVFF